MRPFAGIALSRLGLAFSPRLDVLAQERDRTRIPDEYKWNLADVYPSEAAWRTAKDALVAKIPAVDQYRGTLAASPDRLRACLDLTTEMGKDFARLYSYASMTLDQDTRVSTALGMQQEMSKIGADLAARTSFIEPEILKADSARIFGFVNADKRLEVYRHYLDDILRRRAHTGTEGEEKIIADAGLMADSPENIHSIFANAEFPYPDVTLSDGKTVRLDQAGYSFYRALPNRADREKVFAAFFGALNQFRRTYGTQLNAEVKKNLFYTRARNYDSPLHAALDANNIPVQVYHSLIDNVDRNLSTFHRYLNLRRRILGVDTLHYYDLYAPLLKEADLSYTFDEAKQQVLGAIQPLGADYVRTVNEAFTHRWIDVYPTEGKRSGAYSNGSAYDVHPYILLNYNGKFDDVSTLAHELGHTMHSY